MVTSIIEEYRQQLEEFIVNEGYEVEHTCKEIIFLSDKAAIYYNVERDDFHFDCGEAVSYRTMVLINRYIYWVK